MQRRTITLVVALNILFLNSLRERDVTIKLLI